MSYRRGYEHGARELFLAFEHLLPDVEREVVRKWIQSDIRNWRAENLAGKSGRPVGAAGPTLDIAAPRLAARTKEASFGKTAAAGARMFDHGTCPKCGATVDHCEFDRIIVGDKATGPFFYGVAMCCPACATVLAVSAEPVAMAMDVADRVAKQIRG
jgi:hypothetical protein